MDNFDFTPEPLGQYNTFSDGFDFEKKEEENNAAYESGLEFKQSHIISDLMRRAR